MHAPDHPDTHLTLGISCKSCYHSRMVSVRAQTAGLMLHGQCPRSQRQQRSIAHCHHATHGSSVAFATLSPHSLCPYQPVCCPRIHQMKCDTTLRTRLPLTPHHCCDSAEVSRSRKGCSEFTRGRPRFERPSWFPRRRVASANLASKPYLARSPGSSLVVRYGKSMTRAIRATRRRWPDRAASTRGEVAKTPTTIPSHARRHGCGA